MSKLCEHLKNCLYPQCSTIYHTCALYKFKDGVLKPEYEPMSDEEKKRLVKD